MRVEWVRVVWGNDNSEIDMGERGWGNLNGGSGIGESDMGESQ